MLKLLDKIITREDPAKVLISKAWRTLTNIRPVISITNKYTKKYIISYICACMKCCGTENWFSCQLWKCVYSFLTRKAKVREQFTS